MLLTSSNHLIKRLKIRPLKNISELEAFQEIQRQIWAGQDIDIVPTHILAAQVRAGGLILGAFVEEQDQLPFCGLIGIAQGWPGLFQDEDRTTRMFHYSHTLGVLPEWRKQGIGLEIKLAQRELVLQHSTADAIVWTFDPLNISSGVLNMHKLGARCSQYITNAYGQRNDSLNLGLQTDRCVAVWEIRSAKTEKLLALESNSSTAMQLGSVVSGKQKDWHFVDPLDTSTLPIFDGRQIAVPLPGNIKKSETTRKDSTRFWRLFLRSVLQYAFSSNYEIADCLRFNDSQQYYYVLRQIENKNMISLVNNGFD